MNFIGNRNFRAGPQTSLEGFICPQNSDKQQKIKVFGRSDGGHFINHRKLLKIGQNVVVRPHCDVYSEGILEIGNNTEIGKFSCIASANKIIIGNGVLTGPFIFIADHNHQYEDPSKPIYMQGVKFSKSDRVEIGDETWIGAKVAICGNIRIGKHCVIGANSVVTKDIPDYSVAAGIPAKVIKKYDFTKEEWVKVN